jgi:hypothetical protein
MFQIPITITKCKTDAAKSNPFIQLNIKSVPYPLQ